MVRLKFIVRSGVLVLRISGGKTRFYKRVGYLLKGDPNLKHFNKDKQRFVIANKIVEILETSDTHLRMTGI